MTQIHLTVVDFPNLNCTNKLSLCISIGPNVTWGMTCRADGEINDSIVSTHTHTHTHTQKPLLCVFHFYCIFMYASAGENRMSCGHSSRSPPLTWDRRGVLFRHSPLCSMSLPSPNRFFFTLSWPLPACPGDVYSITVWRRDFLCTQREPRDSELQNSPACIFHKDSLSSLTCHLKNAASVLAKRLIA